MGEAEVSFACPTTLLSLKQSIHLRYSSHKLIDRESDKDCAWVHAYLHRKEGDLWNARYWYRRSSKPESKLSLHEERQQITEALLNHLLTHP